MKFSFVVCTYNRCEYIYEMLERLIASIGNEDSYEILLINNNSTDDTESKCQQFHIDYPNANFRYIVEIKQGLSCARNRGISEANGDYLIFLDDDAFVEPDYVGNLQKHIATHPEVMAFGGEVRPLYESGEEPKWMSRWSYSWVSAIDLGPEIKKFEGKAYPIGANMGIHKKCFEDCGNFDESLGRNKKNMMGGEEKDLFLRLKNYGYDIFFFPGVIVNHVIPVSRTTKEYIKRFAEGVGVSERIRTKEKSITMYISRIALEIVKWIATIVLWVGFLFKGQIQKGNVLVYFRWFVSKKLLFGNI